jgi:hypothetical protein
MKTKTGLSQQPALLPVAVRRVRLRVLLAGLLLQHRRRHQHLLPGELWVWGKAGGEGEAGTANTRLSR